MSPGTRNLLGPVPHLTGWRGVPQTLLWAGLFSPCARPALVDAVLLNNIVQNFGMLDLVKKVLASHKCQMDRSREQYARDLAGTLALRCDPHSCAGAAEAWGR